MLILAIDSSSSVAGVAIGTKDKVIAEMNFDLGLTHSETLMPLIDEIFEKTKLDKRDLGYVAVAQGPGSFTGLRIGASIAKGIAVGLGIKIVPVPTLDFLAYNIVGNCIVCPILDARRDEVYSAFYRSFDFCRLSDYHACNLEEILQMAQGFESQVFFLGDAATKFSKRILAYGGKFHIAPTNLCKQRAASLLALSATLEHTAVLPSDFHLQYLRMSQAERDLVKKEHEI